MSIFSRIWSFAQKLPTSQANAASASGNDPVSTGRYVARASRDAGARRDPIAGWTGPLTSSPAQAEAERKLAQRRSADLAANDWAAASALSAIIYNAIGSGLLPDAAIPAQELGLDRRQAKAIGSCFEWIFSRWAKNCDATGQLSFADLQALGLRSILSQGEMLHLAVARKDNSDFALAIQAIRPQRLQTPVALRADPTIRDGIRLDAAGRPLSYWIANPAASLADSFTSLDTLTIADFSEIPYSRHGRRLVFHLFRREEEEQTRGFTAFGPGIGLFRNLTDALNNELLTQVTASNFSVFIEREDGIAPQVGPDHREEGTEFQEINGAKVFYGAANERPQVIESNRPSANFASFVEIILRAMAASQGIPYETLAKDYSKTNYSSMRAALNEAWKLYNYLRQWFAQNYCQPIWEMVLEDAIASGLVELPKNAPAFAEARDLWCNADWYGPAKGFVDPVKETQATALAMQSGLMTLGEALAELGHDMDEMVQKFADEKAVLEPLGLWYGAGSAAPTVRRKIEPEREAPEEAENQEETEDG